MTQQTISATEFLNQQKEMLVQAINETNDQTKEQSLRDWFAGLAMQSAIRQNTASEIPYKWVAQQAYRMADAMLEESKRVPQ